MIFRLTLLLALIPNLLAGQIRLSENSRIYLITFGASQDQVYTAFGHSAIRIADPDLGFDFVYNYGAFDFNQENFYLNFAVGKPYYSLAKGYYEPTREFYTQNNQTIIEQELNFSQEQKQAVYDFLEWNARPENRSYLYDYFFDNCSTRIPDAFHKALGEAIYLDTLNYETDGKSFRQMVDVYTPQQPWGDLGIDLCLGLEIDQPMKKKDYLFLPEYLYKAVDKGTLMMGDSIIPLVKNTTFTNKEIPTNPNERFFVPKTIFWMLLLAIIIITFIEIRERKHFKIVDILLMGSVWLLGIFLLVLWFGTEHKSAWNFNLLWANPFHAIFLVLMVKNRKPRLVIYHFLGYGLLLVLTLIFWRVLPQELNPDFLPLVIALALRSLWVYRVTTSINN